jgi:nucleotide-binding universal stress UspA family protein
MPARVGRVLVCYEPSPDGRAALLHAMSLAGEAGANLTVMSVATQERVDIGCAGCRHSAAIWNREMRAIAHEELAEAAALVGPTPLVAFAVEAGRPRDAISNTAKRIGADVIVVPHRTPGRFRRRGASRLAEQLRRDPGWEVVIAPDTARLS